MSIYHWRRQEPLLCEFAVSILLAKGTLHCGNFLLYCPRCEPSDSSHGSTLHSIVDHVDQKIGLCTLDRSARGRSQGLGMRLACN